MNLLNQLIRCIASDIETRTNDFFKFYLNEEWKFGNASKFCLNHYRNHVLQEDGKWEEFPSEADSDGEYRIKMPPMSKEEYIKRAEELANTPAKPIKEIASVIGGTTFRYKNNGKSFEAFAKIRTSSNFVIEPEYAKDGKLHRLTEMCEIVIYNRDGNKPIIITYMLGRNVRKVIANMNFVSNLPESEINIVKNIADAKRPTYHCVIQYDSREEKIIDFDTYQEAQDYFSTNKYASELFKTLNGESKSISKRNSRNVVPLKIFSLDIKDYFSDKGIDNINLVIGDKLFNDIVDVLSDQGCTNIKDKKTTEKIDRALWIIQNKEELEADGDSNFDFEKEVIDSLYEKYIKVNIKFNHDILNEANRQQLLQKSRNAKRYKDQSKGKNRYERRMKSKISATVRDYNNIQMDQLFKRDILEIKIPVMGETDVYEVHVKIEGVLSEVHKQILANKGKLEFKVILQSLMKVLNIGNVFISCTCPDYTYRQRYWATKNNYVAGGKETRPSNKTNPDDSLGAGCKHVMLILANLDWCVKVASVINNYVKYCQENLEQAYATYIFPKLYGVKYDKAVQMDLFYDGMLPDDKKTMDTVIKQGMVGKDRTGKFTKDNPYKFKKQDMSEPTEDDNNLKLNFEEPEVEKELSTEEEPE